MSNFGQQLAVSTPDLSVAPVAKKLPGSCAAAWCVLARYWVGTVTHVICQIPSGASDQVRTLATNWAVPREFALPRPDVPPLSVAEGIRV